MEMLFSFILFLLCFQFSLYTEILFLIFVFEDILVEFFFLEVVLHHRHKEIFVTCSTIFIGIKYNM